MKKFFNLSLACLFAIGFLLVGCEKEHLPSVQEDSASNQYKSIASTVLTTAKANTNFRMMVYQECNKQAHGDYYVTLSRLMELNITNNFWDESTVSKLANLQSSILQKTGQDIIIFVPSIEKHPEKAIPSKAEFKTTIFSQEPIAVISDEYAPATQMCPGYVVGSNGVLSYAQTIDESSAWENDVWVVGSEEDVSPENMVAAAEDTATLNYERMPGGAEYGGILKVTDWSLVEPWVAGKPEFKILVYKGAGSPTEIKNKGFGKWRRANFNNQFKDFGEFLYFWNTSNIGDYTTEKWIEEDGGITINLTFGVKIKILGVETTVGVSTQIKNQDDDLGLTLIQFTDPISTVYSLTGIEIKRRN